MPKINLSQECRYILRGKVASGGEATVLLNREKYIRFRNNTNTLTNKPPKIGFESGQTGSVEWCLSKDVRKTLSLEFRSNFCLQTRFFDVDCGFGPIHDRTERTSRRISSKIASFKYAICRFLCEATCLGII